ncbi:MAG: endonuclease III [Deltaproteobacteria bacterium]|nr:endonuclease III [Deltaproteobacteria bacterium]
MQKNNSINKIITYLKNKYPSSTTALKSENPFQLLIATILSAQCTDERVNKVTPALFRRYKTPSDFANADISELEDYIRSTGFYHNKAKNIIECCKMLVNEYNGILPEDIEKLVKLPGIGRKTANVVLGNGFGIASGIVVDTHVLRISQRLGLTDRQDPLKAEEDLMKIIPRDYWIGFSNAVILFGREICNARKPLCNNCGLTDVCRYFKETNR